MRIPALMLYISMCVIVAVASVHIVKFYDRIYKGFQTENTQYLQRDACVRELLKTVQDRSAIAVKGHTCWEIKYQPESLHDWEGK